jgi:tetratricopeptide (TPR) repeat protein
MIQPLKSARSSWVVYWLDLDEPVPAGQSYFLPTLVVVCDDSGTPVGSPSVLEELDQVRVENMLVRLFESAGPPDRVTICESPDWDHDAWAGFSREQRVEIRFTRTGPSEPGEVSALARSVLVRYVSGGSEHPAPPTRVAAGLLETASRVSSPTKREALLKAALENDPDCAEARIELADADFTSGNWKTCMAAYEEIIKRESRRLQGTDPAWWEDRDTRPFLRARYGRAMTLWHRGKYAEAAAELAGLLELNPRDNQGVRFFIPMLHLLAEDIPEARAAFAHCENRYPEDYPEPAFLFGRALTHSLDGDESAARQKYREAILRNIYIAPLLLEEPAPPRTLWLPNDRAEPGYAQEFLDSYAVLWDRESGSLRILREAWSEMSRAVSAIVAHRQFMLDFQDQRYEPNFKTLWQELLDRDEQLTGSPPDED